LIIVQTDPEGNPDLDWTPVEWGCGKDCERGEPRGGISRACDGTTLIYVYSREGDGFAVIPNSPECGYIPPAAESSPAPTATATPTPVG